MKFPRTTSSGKLIIVATMKIVPGKEERMAEIMAAAQAYALSDAEPNTLEYRVTRVLEPSGQPTSTFIIVEEYNGPEIGFSQHAKSSGTRAMMKAFKEEGILLDSVLTFCDELPPKPKL
ncbi:hypothetical protein D9757_013887 [Collybiopsis confluens]|uniref:ABM domain-containing protein n=1 Tax=Collybiopsis confluens TaxID=2823264 RepID=A0A8H5CLN9_9AGAR|nr:hypothetical protein D9757_014194 [Collybiopsis confluens]KAF5344044.1 hypothetical protein D9757_013887 [Collybiopsis confluens]